MAESLALELPERKRQGEKLRGGIVEGLDPFGEGYALRARHDAAGTPLPPQEPRDPPFVEKRICGPGEAWIFTDSVERLESTLERRGFARPRERKGTLLRDAAQSREERSRRGIRVWHEERVDGMRRSVDPAGQVTMKAQKGDQRGAIVFGKTIPELSFEGAETDAIQSIEREERATHVSTAGGGVPASRVVSAAMPNARDTRRATLEAPKRRMASRPWENVA